MNEYMKWLMKKQKRIWLEQINSAFSMEILIKKKKDKKDSEMEFLSRFPANNEWAFFVVMYLIFSTPRL